MRHDICSKALEVLKEAFPDLEISHLDRSNDTLGTRIEFRFAEKTAEGRAAALADFNRKALVIGLPENILGHEFVFRKRTYAVRGANPGASRFSVSCERDDGKIFRFEPMTVIAGLKSPSGVALNKGRTA